VRKPTGIDQQGEDSRKHDQSKRSQKWVNQ